MHPQNHHARAALHSLHAIWPELQHAQAAAARAEED